MQLHEIARLVSFVAFFRASASAGITPASFTPWKMMLLPRLSEDSDPLAYKGRVDLISHQAILRDCLYLNERSNHDGIQVTEVFPGEVKFCCRFDLLDWQLTLVHLQLGQRPAVIEIQDAPDVPGVRRLTCRYTRKRW